MTWKETDEKLIRRGELILDLTFLEKRDEELKSMNTGKRGPRYRLTNSCARVRYDSKAEKIMVVRPSGEILYSEKMSKRATDQCYLSIRIALGKKILGGQKGFFVMDDIFMASDNNKLNNQLKMLNKLSRDGWQIIYLTAKDEIKEALERISGKAAIELARLP